MADEQVPRNEKKSGSKTRDWVVRGVVFGTLGVLLVLALFDFLAKKNAEATYAAWQTTMQANDLKNEETFPEDLEAAAQGSFTKVDEYVGGVTRRRYTWNGVFRSYPILADLSPGKKPFVTELTPPSEAAEIPPLEDTPVDDAPAPSGGHDAE